ncbi:ABC transporter substrate-binding protein [Rhodobacteraceae bacterium RKSG542]|uniref:ABC transporter substrate-binding protein n=1 Tax=Pseudovibrio flavus TaxID=2529854 RepID=UPI0012BD0D94|nr:ABC transporter substrate-binding protein [Pseudovibrio flavus]MTI18182.1 ABC transporter substrate-binding protein [Pseudovibrio flavus]
MTRALVTSSLIAMMSTSALAGDITVYTSYEEDEAAAFLDLAREALPDVNINMLRLSTGDLAARIIAEKGNPQHDVVWGFAASTIVNPQIKDTLEPYKPAGVEAIPAAFRAKDGTWFAVTGYMAAFCVNNERLEKLGLEMPTSWADLTDPAFKGEVVMPNPASSGTGYIQVSSLLQMKGAEQGWAFLDDLDKNIAQYIKSGSKPCHAASAGEYTVGASYDMRAIKNIKEGFPISMVIPAEGSGNELEANALVASSKNKEDARRFLDWTVTDEAATAYLKWKAIVTIPGGTMPQHFLDAGLPADTNSVLHPTDFEAAANDRDAILAEWQGRYE